MTATAKHIPPEAVEAAAKALAAVRMPNYTWGDLDREMQDYLRADARAATAAALSAWPGVKLENLCGWVMDGPDLPYVEETVSIILPLTEGDGQ